MSVKKVAELAGVSQSTVYRVIAGRPEISLETADKVKEVMDSLGYRPRTGMRKRGPRSRSKVGIHTAQVAFVYVGQAQSSASMAIIQGLQKSLAEQEVELVFTQMPDFHEVPPIIAKRRVDGIVLHGWNVSRPSGEVGDMLRRIPAVWLMTHREDWGDQVQPDNLMIGRMAGRYLIERDHQHLAYLIAEPNHLAFEERGKAFAEQADSAGLREPVTVSRLVYGFDRQYPTLEVFNKLIDELKALDPFPTGLFVAEDNWLKMLYPTLLSRGIHPGKDIEIISCGHKHEELQGLEPRPASVDMAMDEIGRHAAKQLLWRMAHRDERTRVIVEVEPAGVM